MFVIYGVSTHSLPAHTAPISVTVMFEKAVAPIIEIGETVTQLVVNGEIIEAPQPYINDEGVVMIPLRAAAEALGFEVTWDGEYQKIGVGQFVTLEIGRDYYSYARMAPIELGTAPVLENSTTFVPLKFFKEVLHQNSAYVFEGQAIISDEIIDEYINLI